MTIRHAGYVVTLTSDMREDDAEQIIAALRMVKGVAGVEPVTGGIDIQIAVTRARTDIEKRLWDALRAKPECPAP